MKTGKIMETQQNRNIRLRTEDTESDLGLEIRNTGNKIMAKSIKEINAYKVKHILD